MKFNLQSVIFTIQVSIISPLFPSLFTFTLSKAASVDLGSHLEIFQQCSIHIIQAYIQELVNLFEFPFYVT